MRSRSTLLCVENSEVCVFPSLFDLPFYAWKTPPVPLQRGKVLWDVSSTLLCVTNKPEYTELCVLLTVD
jgi:hypothetical protein